MLSMQLQPHFLFNTLNTIAELVHQQPAAAERMIGGLSHLLRETLHAGLVDRVPLSQELALLDRYIEIQRARFGDRLKVTVTVPDEANHALVPTLLLQPLVENAIKHGIGARAGAGHIEITAAKHGEQLQIAIADDGRGLPSGSLPGGIGLDNCRSRLQTLYGVNAFALSIANRPTGGDNRDRLAAVADRVMLRIVIVDDEPPARARLRRLLKAHDDVEVVAECGDGATAVQVIEAESPDLVLLDVQMPELDGFEVLRTLDVPKLPEIIFVTAFDKYAVRAFEVHALDYVVKPVEQDRLDHALVRARQHLSEQRDAIAGLLRDLARERAYLTRMPVRSEGRVKVIDLAEVDWLGAADNYVTIHAGAREYLVRDTIAAVERQLDPAQFVRVHRSTIVRIDRIAELVPELHGDFRIRLKNGAELALSRTYRARVEAQFGRKF